MAASHLLADFLHTAPERQSVNLDLFSCRTFDDDLVLAAVEHLFHVTKYLRWTVLSR